MSRYLNACHPGTTYGDGYMQGEGHKGQFVKVVDNDLFAVNTDPAVVSFGILSNHCRDGEMPGVWCGGGVYETDQYAGSISANDLLIINDSGNLITIGSSATGKVVAQAISVSGGLLKFKLLV